MKLSKSSIRKQTDSASNTISQSRLCGPSPLHPPPALHLVATFYSLKSTKLHRLPKYYFITIESYCLTHYLCTHGNTSSFPSLLIETVKKVDPGRRLTRTRCHQMADERATRPLLHSGDDREGDRPFTIMYKSHKRKTSGRIRIQSTDIRRLYIVV